MFGRWRQLKKGIMHFSLSVNEPAQVTACVCVCLLCDLALKSPPNSSAADFNPLIPRAHCSELHNKLSYLLFLLLFY